MNELVIQNYLLFAICWFGALFVLCLSVLWMFYGSNTKTNSSKATNTADRSSDSHFNSVLETTFLNSGSSNSAIDMPKSTIRSNSPALRGSHFPSVEPIARQASPENLAPSLHIRRAEQLANQEKLNATETNILTAVSAFHSNDIHDTTKIENQQKQPEIQNSTSILESENQISENQIKIEPQAIHSKSKVDFSALSGEDIERTQLDLAQALSETGRLAFANSILKEVLENSSDPNLKLEAEQLLNSLALKPT